MEEQRMDWGSNDEPAYNKSDILFFVLGLVAMLALLKFNDRFFWVAMPFAFTYLVKSLKMM